MAIVLLGSLALNACYTTRPIAGGPVAGSQVLFDLTDRGRVAYGPQIGAGAREIEGTLEGASDSAYVVRITSIRSLNGQKDTWSGERFSFAPDHVTNLRQRQLSRTRTGLFGAAVAAGVIILAVTAKLIGGASEDSNPGEPRPGPGER